MALWCDFSVRPRSSERPPPVAESRIWLYLQGMARGSDNTEDQRPQDLAGRGGAHDGFWHPFIELAAITAIFFIAGGAAAPHVNETHYLTKAKHYWDPSYCPGDMFLDAADAHLTYYWTVGWLTLWMPLGAAAWVSRIAAWLLIAAGWRRLAREVMPARWASVLAALVWVVLMDKCDFAGEWVVGGLHGKGGVEAKCFAYGLVLFGLADVAAGRWKRPWLWFGAAAAFHVLVGGWAVIAGLGVWLGEPRQGRPSFGSLLPALAIGGLLSMPGLIPALALDWGVAPNQAAEAARIYVYERLPHHLAPTEQSPEDFARRARRFGVLVIAFASLVVWRSRHPPMSSATSSDARRSESDALTRIMRFAALALVGSCIGLCIAILGAHAPERAAMWLRFYWFRQADVMVPAAVALAAVSLLLQAQRSASQPSAKRAQLALVTAMLLCSAYVARIALDRVRSDAPPALGRTENPAAWVAACEWIRDHAPPDAVCLIPRQAQSFKWYAERADVVNWKDVPQDAAGVIEWHRRIRDVYPTISGPDGPLVLNSPEQWGARRVLDVARRYHASYVIARSEPPLGLREVYSAASPDNGVGYSVYAVAIRGSANANKGEPE
jgi:hypothetical protein